jgi:preprotein translocase subunit SecB
MSDISDNQGGPAGGNGGPGGEQMQAPITVNAQYLKDFSFENPNAPQSLGQTTPPAIEVGVNVGTRNLAPGVFEVTLALNGTAKRGDQTVFIAELTYAGVFTLQGIPEEHVRPVLLIECPRLLFPFARNILADATREGGYPPLLLQPVDFVDLYRRQVEAAGGSPGTATA